MLKFANVLEELVTSHGIANLRWVTIQNEPNTPKQKHQVEPLQRAH